MDSLGFTWTREKGTSGEPKREKGKVDRATFEPVLTRQPPRARTHEPKPKSISRLDSPPNLRFVLVPEYTGVHIIGPVSRNGLTDGPYMDFAPEMD